MNNFKYLDIDMCENMEWIEQINSITQKTRKMIYIMREFRDILNEKDLRLIYLTLIEPIISYEIISWREFMITPSLDFKLVKIH